jgi:hypothetical protein
MSPFMPNEYAVKATTFYQRGRCKHPHPSLLLPRPYAVLLGGVANQYQMAVMPPSEAQAAPVT